MITMNGKMQSVPLARAIPLLGQKVDRLHALRQTIMTFGAEERQLTNELKRCMGEFAIGAVHGDQAIAILERRPVLVVDSESLFDLIGHEAFAAMTVSTTAARKMLPKAALAAISEHQEQVTLRVDRIEDAARGDGASSSRSRRPKESRPRTSRTPWTIAWSRWTSGTSTAAPSWK